MSHLRLSDAERLFAEKDAAYQAELAEYSAKLVAEEAAGIERPVEVSLHGSDLDAYLSSPERWAARRLSVEREAALIALRDLKFRQIDPRRYLWTDEEKREYDEWLYNGPKPPPNPSAERIKWIAKLVAVLAFLSLSSAVALAISGVVVLYFHEAGFLAVAIYWLIQWRHWRAVYKAAKALRERGEEI
jgi:hypothetical protein